MRVSCGLTATVVTTRAICEFEDRTLALQLVEFGAQRRGGRRRPFEVFANARLFCAGLRLSGVSPKPARMSGDKPLNGRPRPSAVSFSLTRLADVPSAGQEYSPDDSARRKRPITARR